MESRIKLHVFINKILAWIYSILAGLLIVIAGKYDDSPWLFTAHFLLIMAAYIFMQTKTHVIAVGIVVPDETTIAYRMINKILGIEFAVLGLTLGVTLTATPGIGLDMRVNNHLFSTYLLIEPLDRLIYAISKRQHNHRKEAGN